MIRPPARCLFVITTTDFGGTESFLQRLVTDLDRERFEPLVCSLCPPGRIADELRSAGVEVVDLGMARRALPHQMAAAAVRLARLIDRQGIDLVQSLLYRANVLAAVARRVSRRRPVLVAGQRSLIPAGRGRDAWAQRLTRGWADRIIAVSEAVRDELLATESIAPERVVVIGNGVDIERFSREQPDAVEGKGEGESWPLDAGAPKSKAIVVGAVGRLHPPKGLRYLIEAMAVARSDDPRLQLVIAGDGPESDALRAQAENAGLGAHCRFLGYRADPSSLYPAFDIFALPSLAEGSPNALLEAMASARACIASRVGGVPEVLVDGESGVLVPPADPQALASALVDLAADSERRQRLGAAARSRITEVATLEMMIDCHERLYEDLLVYCGGLKHSEQESM